MESQGSKLTISQAAYLDDDGTSSSDEQEFSDDEDEASAGLRHDLKRTSLDTQAQAVMPSIGSPITWFTSSAIAHPTKVGIFTVMLPESATTVQSLQLREGIDRSIAMFMTGGGHFQGTIISINGSSVGKCDIIASKGFHRYTTRRKQGGAQSANDNAKGAAKSAGAQIRRYNEIALAEDIRGLLKDWKNLLNKAEVILIRASGQSSKKLLFENGLDKQDPRIRGFPLNTRRATQSEIIRSFHTLTRLQVGSVLDDIVEEKPKQKEVAKVPEKVEEKPDLVAVEHTDKLIALIKRNKVPRLRAYVGEHKMHLPAFTLEPRKTYIHTPTLLHYASSIEAAPCIAELLTLGSDPTIANTEGKTAFEVAGTKKTRDAFRIWRGRNEDKWNWEVARIPVGLSAEQVAARQAKEAEERAADEAAENERRTAESEKLEAEAAKAREQELLEAERRRGPARSLAVGVLGNSASTSLEGLTPQMRQKIERERRARAAEARFKK